MISKYRLFSDEMKASISLFVEMTLAAVTLSVIFTTIFFQFGLPSSYSDLLSATTAVALLVSVPMAALAAQHSYKIKLVNNQLNELASTDALTGLINRRAFLTILDDEIRRLQRIESVSAVAFFDLDHFKAVNDRYGHSFGDAALAHVANMVHGELRGPFDKVCRWGGEEFLILLSDVDDDTLALILERLRRKIATTPCVHEGVAARVTASFGACKLRKEDSVDQILEQADIALYRAKADGRNTVAIAADSEPTPAKTA